MSDRGQEVLATGEKILTLDSCESATPWSEGATGTDNLERTFTHRSGRFAIAFDKIAGGTTASISRTFESPKALGDRAEEAKLVLRALIPDVTNVAKLYVDLGDGTNYNTYEVDDSELASGVWERIEKKVTEPDAVVANGMNTEAITWMQVRVVFDAAGDTLADMVIDEAFFFFGDAEQSTTMGTDIAAINAKLPTLGAKAGTGSVSVVEAKATWTYDYVGAVARANDVVVATPGAGFRIRILAGHVDASAAMNVYVDDTAALVKVGPLYLGANCGRRIGVTTFAENVGLRVTSSVAAAQAIHIEGDVVAV